MLRALLILGVACALAAPARAIQPGATGSLRVQNGAADVLKVDGGDSGAGTTAAANTSKVLPRRADDCTAQTDGSFGELCIDDYRGLYVCVPTAGACDTAAEWVRQTRMRVEKNGSLVSGGDQIYALDFDNRFSITCTAGKCTIVPGTEFTMLGSTIDKAEMPAAVAYEDEANDFGTNAQTFKKLIYKNNAGTTKFDCGNSADGSCRYSGAYSDNTDVATKANVSARASHMMSGWSSTYANVWTTRQYMQDNVRNTLVNVWIYQIVPADCTTGTFRGRVVAYGAWPSGATIEVGYTKNESTTAVTTCSVSSATGNCSSATTTSFTAGDRVHFFAQCTGTCTDGATILAAQGAFLCTAN